MLYSEILVVLWILVLCVAEESLIDQHPSWKFIPKKTCGRGRIQVRSRIVLGKKARLGEFPWIARLGWTYKQYINFSCGGTLINRFYVLSAAHCGTRHNIVKIGQISEIEENNCDRRGCAPPAQNIRVERFIEGNFSEETHVNDIMLVQLRTEAKFNEFTMPACLPSGQLLHLDLVDKELVVAGWGATNNTGGISSPDLMFAIIPVVKHNECDEIYDSVIIPERQICAGFHQGPDSCSGDSGGPLTKTFGKRSTRQSFLMGIVSYGPGKCGEGPAVYTRVSYYMDWILNNIKK